GVDGEALGRCPRRLPLIGRSTVRPERKGTPAQERDQNGSHDEAHGEEGILGTIHRNTSDGDVSISSSRKPERLDCTDEKFATPRTRSSGPKSLELVRGTAPHWSLALSLDRASLDGMTGENRDSTTTSTEAQRAPG